MNRYNVAILYGGKSGEHDISLMSASSVEKHLDKNRFNVHLIGITMSGKWFYQPDYKNTNDTLDIEEDEKNIISIIPGKGFTVNNTDLNIDFVFPILHGTYGEDGTVQGLLDLINIPYAGSGLDGSFMAMDKEFAKILWQNRGLPVVPFISFKKHQYITNPSMVISEISNKFDYPLFIKPVKAGSSVGVSRVSCQSELSEALEKAFTFDLKVLIEPAVNAREIECSVIGNNSPQTFSLGEIAPSHEFYDYEAKYLDPNGAKLIIPAQIDKAIIQEMKKLAITAYSTLKYYSWFYKY
ncbi:MAG: hypothetical protein B6229_06400 [Spirochaetaceae bacterium 4572_7]|nr:MAG: hypothetical protein B6229_06400 [Spirochaetaceae bacterium 4572_7]